MKNRYVTFWLTLLLTLCYVPAQAQWTAWLDIGFWPSIGCCNWNQDIEITLGSGQTSTYVSVARAYGISSGPTYAYDLIRTYKNGQLVDSCSVPEDRARGWDCDDPGWTGYSLIPGSYDFRAKVYVVNHLGQEFKVADNEYTITVNPPPSVPSPPTNLQITNAGSQNVMPNLSWTASPSSGVSHYRLYRRCSASPSCWSWAVIASPTGTSWIDSGVLMGGTQDYYYYKVTAVSTGGQESNASNTVSTYGRPFGYRVVGGIESVLARAVMEEVIPKDYALGQNYPNPFNPTTEIRFALPEASDVSLVVYDITGKEIEHLVNGRLEAGHHRVNFNAENVLPSGVYLYRLVANKFTATGRMTLVK